MLWKALLRFWLCKMCSATLVVERNSWKSYQNACHKIGNKTVSRKISTICVSVPWKWKTYAKLLCRNSWQFYVDPSSDLHDDEQHNRRRSDSMKLSCDLRSNITRHGKMRLIPFNNIKFPSDHVIPSRAYTVWIFSKELLTVERIFTLYILAVCCLINFWWFPILS